MRFNGRSSNLFMRILLGDVVQKFHDTQEGEGTKSGEGLRRNNFFGLTWDNCDSERLETFPPLVTIKCRMSIIHYFIGDIFFIEAIYLIEISVYGGFTTLLCFTPVSLCTGEIIRYRKLL